MGAEREATKRDWYGRTNSEAEWMAWRGIRLRAGSGAEQGGDTAREQNRVESRGRGRVKDKRELHDRVEGNVR